MKKLPKTLLMLSAFISSISVMFFSCAKSPAVSYAEIPFSLENNRIILDATVNGKTGKFIFDTGATISAMQINKKKLRYHAYLKEGKKRISIYNLDEITFGNIKLKTHSWIQNSEGYTDRILKKEGYDGLLGLRIFEGYWCELSFSKQKIILHSEKPDYFTNYSDVLIENKYNDPHYIPVVIDNEIFFFEIDTGLNEGIFFPDGIIRFKTKNEITDVLSIAETGPHHVVKINAAQILDETYNDAFVIANSYLAARSSNIFSHDYNDMGLIGIKFLKYYDFLFDLRKLRKGKTTGLYYKSNTPLSERDYGFFGFIKDMPFGVTDFEINDSGLHILSVIKDSIAYNNFNLRPGTIVTKINGRSITDFSPNELRDPLFYQTINDYSREERNKE